MKKVEKKGESLRPIDETVGVAEQPDIEDVSADEGDI